MPDADADEGGGGKVKPLSRAQLKQLEAAVERGEHDGEIEADPEMKRHLEEFYPLDYEDIVGGIPTRFKYREVVANDYGLTTEEVMQADDHELNSWANLRRIVQFRAEEDERRDRRVYKKRRGACGFSPSSFHPFKQFD